MEADDIADDISDDYVLLDNPDWRRPKVPFQYLPLESKNHFRLLKLLAGPKDTAIDCILDAFEIETPQCPSYRAVSYEWGTDEAHHAVRIRNGALEDESGVESFVLVRQNLRNLLHHVRHANHDCWLWIDAICIDQTSVEERNHQVRLMGKLYSKAHTVLAWLGEPARDIDHDHLDRYGTHGFGVRTAFEFMRKATTFDSSGQSLKNYCRSIWEEPLLDQETKDSQWQFEWGSVADFCDLAYWTRKWIIQEILVASTVVLQWGQAQFPMRIVEDFFCQLNGNPFSLTKASARDQTQVEMHQEWEETFGKLDLPGRAASRLACHRFAIRARISYPDKLYKLLPHYERSRCKEPCDHVYALYNLLGEQRQHLPIDYNQSPVRRCFEILEFMQKHDGLSEKKVVFTAFLLEKLLRLGSIVTKSENQEQLSDMGPWLTATVFDWGRVIRNKVDETHEMLSVRGRLRPIPPIPKWSFMRSEEHWELTSETIPSHAVSNMTVSPLDFTRFLTEHREFYGLATVPLRESDNVWQFEKTDIALVVRCSGLTAEIVGRAVLFEKDPMPAKSSSLSVLQPFKLEHATGWLDARKMRLRCVDLLELASRTIYSS